MVEHNNKKNTFYRKHNKTQPKWFTTAEPELDLITFVQIFLAGGVFITPFSLITPNW